MDIHKRAEFEVALRDMAKRSPALRQYIELQEPDLLDEGPLRQRPQLVREPEDKS